MANQQSTETEKKWQELYISQLSYSINLILGMATGAIGFCMSQMSNFEKDQKIFLQWSVFILIGSVLFGVACTLIRLNIFRHRKEHPDHEERGAVMCLFVLQIASFLFSIFWLGYLYSDFNKLFKWTGIVVVPVMIIFYIIYLVYLQFFKGCIKRIMTNLLKSS